MKVSIITPTYNCSNFIADTINSILNQTFDDFEIIIVDDCSSDDTLNIINSFSDTRIKVFVNEKNQGAAYCRNKAICEAAGEYIAFLDGDDLWATEKLAKQVEFMEKNKLNFSYTNYGVLTKDGDRLNYYYTAPSKITHKIMMRTCYIGCLTVMFRRCIYPDISVPDSISKRNDYAMWLKLLERCDGFLLNETLSYYRQNNGISSGNKASLIKYHATLFRVLYKYGKCKAWLFALRNVIFYIFKQLKYKKRTRK